MDRKTKSAFMAWSMLHWYTDKLAATIETMRNMMQNRIINIAVSGGKDSLVMLDLAMKIDPSAYVWHWDYGIYMPRRIEDEVIDILSVYDMNLTIDRRWSREVNCGAGYRAFFVSIKNHIATNKITLNLVGLRAEESCSRRERCRIPTEWHHGTDALNYFPIHNWTWRDVWAYIVSNKLRYPSTYDIIAPVKGWDETRFVTFFDPEFEHLGEMQIQKFLLWRDRFG